MIPPIVSQFISLIKDTSLATIILLPEAMYRAEIIYGQNVNYMIPMYVALAPFTLSLTTCCRWLHGTWPNGWQFNLVVVEPRIKKGVIRG